MGFPRPALARSRQNRPAASPLLLGAGAVKVPVRPVAVDERARPIAEAVHRQQGRTPQAVPEREVLPDGPEVGEADLRLPAVRTVLVDLFGQLLRVAGLSPVEDVPLDAAPAAERPAPARLGLRLEQPERPIALAAVLLPGAAVGAG